MFYVRDACNIVPRSRRRSIITYTVRGKRGIWVSNITADEKTRDSASFAFLYNIPFDIQLIVLQRICAHI